MTDRFFRVALSRRRWTALALAGALAAGPTLAQQMTGAGALGGFRQNPDLPIEIAADSLEVRQTDQVAVFAGKVDARQGDFRLQAERVEVVYAAQGQGAKAAQAAPEGAIRRLKAQGDVFITNGTETAQGNWADYDVATGIVTMGDDVILTQGKSVIRAPKLRVDLNAGQGRLEGGRVETLFRRERK